MSIETGSLSAAARQLKTPLPTVSRKVFELVPPADDTVQPVEPQGPTQATILRKSTP
jgi:hypothetical protein